MGLRFRKSFKLFPGVRLNINENSYGVTIGPKGAHTTLNSKGNVTRSVGLPGTGLSYSTRTKEGRKVKRASGGKKKPVGAIAAGVLIVGAIASVGRGGRSKEAAVSRSVPSSTPAITQWTPTPAPALTLAPEPVNAATTSRSVIPLDATPDESIFAIIPNSTHEYESTGFDGIVTIYTQYSLYGQPNDWGNMKESLIAAVDADPVVTKCNVYAKDDILLLSVSADKLVDQYELSKADIERRAELDAKLAQIASGSTNTSAYGRTVYVTQTGKKYHYSSTCNGGTYYPISYSEAVKNYEPCEKCVH